MKYLPHTVLMITTLSVTAVQSDEQPGSKLADTDTVAELLKFSATLTSDEHGKVKKLTLRTNVTDGTLLHVKRLKNLESLTLANTGVTDAGLAHLKSLTKLAELNLRGTKVTNAGLTHLSRMRNLRLLDFGSSINGTQVTYDAVAKLKQALPKVVVLPRFLNVAPKERQAVALAELRNLGAGRGGLWYKDDRGVVVGIAFHDRPEMHLAMEHLEGLTNVKWLNFTYANVSDAGLRHLGGLTNLERLMFRDTKITDAGLTHLNQLKNLKELHLHGNITDAGLARLTRLSNLKILRLAGTQVTDEGVKKIQRALPNCKIHRSLK